MASYYDREEEQARLRRRLSKEAVALAMQGCWEEAAAVNRNIIASFPHDIESYNRLGRALAELGELAQAREAYMKVLELAPNNAIAQKNLSRLAKLTESEALTRGAPYKVAPELFVAETGKAGTVSLVNLAPHDVLAKMGPGSEVHLKVEKQHLIVETNRMEYLGRVEPKYESRLVKLMKGGNRYAAAILSVEESGVKVIIREVYQHPSQAGQLSFPAKIAEIPHVLPRMNLGATPLEEGEGLEEAEYPEKEEKELPEGFSILEDAAEKEL
jgi:hypothetical protein